MQISVLLCSRVGEYLSFIDPPLGGFGGILPEVMIFSEGLLSMIYYTES